MRIILHIGLEKTGTTAIQAHCAANAGALLRSGVLYPEGFGYQKHEALAFAVVPDADMRANLRLPADLDVDSYRADVVARLEAAVARVRPDALLLSSEHLAPRLSTPERVETLRQMLAALSDDIRIVVYLRRQDDLVLSLYSTLVKSGGTADPARLLAIGRWFDFDWMLGLWEQVFGRDAMVVRRYPPPGGVRLTDDFLTAAGVPVVGATAPEATVNPALDHSNTELLRAINRHLPMIVDGRINPRRAGLVEFFERRSVGPALGLPPEERKAILDRFRDGNARVAARHFPGEAQLFADPVAPPQPAGPVTLDDAAQLAADIWAHWSVQAAGPPPGGLRRAGQALRRRLAVRRR